MRTSAAIAAAALACVGVVAAQTTSRPGEMTQARVWVENRAAGEAIPVAVQNAPQVTVAGSPEVRIAAGASVGARRVAQRWEYRSVLVPPGADPAAAITAAGADSWEAVGLAPSGSDGRLMILLKRPR
jgi:hypothetical protein